MRIIAGTYRGRAIQAPAGLATRPTSDRLRETLFNVLAPRIQGASFLDLFAGSGAVGIEALSRGASRVAFVERAKPALSVLSANLARLGVSSGFRVHPISAAGFLRRPQQAPFDIVFLDPPYDAANDYELCLTHLGDRSAQLLSPAALVIAEHHHKEPPADAYGALHRTRLLKQGEAALSFYWNQGPVSQPPKDPVK
jgi:16S rRNA (guanine(966)-N(2))-methyltransferase RsmD